MLRALLSPPSYRVFRLLQTLQLSLIVTYNVTYLRCPSKGVTFRSHRPVRHLRTTSADHATGSVQPTSIFLPHKSLQVLQHGDFNTINTPQIRHLLRPLQEALPTAPVFTARITPPERLGMRFDQRLLLATFTSSLCGFILGSSHAGPSRIPPLSSRECPPAAHSSTRLVSLPQIQKLLQDEAWHNDWHPARRPPCSLDLHFLHY